MSVPSEKALAINDFIDEALVLFSRYPTTWLDKYNTKYKYTIVNTHQLRLSKKAALKKTYQPFVSKHAKARKHSVSLRRQHCCGVNMAATLPPLQRDYALLKCHPAKISPISAQTNKSQHDLMDECELPLIDLSGIVSQNPEIRHECATAIAKASMEWGFFQVVNHGISPQLLRDMRREQVNLFDTSFEQKNSCGILNNSYRWGNPTATSATQFSWSEAFHVPLAKISDEACFGNFTSLRNTMEEFALAMSKLAKQLIGVLAERLGHSKSAFDDICDERTCFLRLNHYPACPVSPEVFGLVPHTDSDFLTILYQDQVGGLQLRKDSKWVAVKPNQDALIVNIGDLLQAWSNNDYKSVEHKVMANAKVERYSVAYFLCPSNESLIGSCREPSMYKSFTFGEYRKQIQEDVKNTGHKVGLPRFLAPVK